MSLLIFSPYFPPHVGGVEAYVSEFLTVCTPERAGTAITVVSTRLPPAAAERETAAHGVAVRRLPAVDAVPNYPVPALWLPALWRTLRDATAQRPAVVVSHTRFFLTSLLAWGVARRCHARWVHVEHGSDYVQLDSRVSSSVARIYDRLVGRQVLRRADACVAISAAAADFVRRLSGRHATVLYRGVDPRRLDAPPSAEVERLAAGRLTIVYVGRLIDGKGVADLIEALARLDGEPPFCCLVGDGPRRAELEALVRARGLENHVAFLGYRPEEEIVPLIKAADVVVNPSYSEGLPTAVLLAALCGRAVVATDVGGTREVIEHGVSGLLVEPRDPAGLSAELARALADRPLRSTLGASAQASASRRFAWEPAVDAFLALAGLRGGAAPAPPAPAPARAMPAPGSEASGPPS